MPAFVITTAIDYPNGAPHMGHAYEKVVSDAYARWYRFLGWDVFFLTGTDENGQNLQKRAKDVGLEPQAFVDQHVELFRKLCRDLMISNDDFIRTTESRHHEAAASLWSTICAKGDIYFDRYRGHYCYACESFYLESQAADGSCPVHRRPLEFVEEDGYFFRLSAYVPWLIDHVERHAEFIFPSSARREVLARLKGGDPIRDLSVSRPNTGWGIPVPGDAGHVMYTWFDALINYYAATRDRGLWPATMHVIGKDITWFHSVIWPAMLQSAGLPLPSQVYVHGMILGEDGRKMSKSLKNGVEPYDVLGEFPLDVFRYYLLRSFPSGADGAFVRGELRNKNDRELANDYGNCLMRLLKLAEKRLGRELGTSDVAPDFDWEGTCHEMARWMDAREHTRALDVLWEGLGRVNAYLNQHEPWKIRDDPTRLRRVLVNGLHSMHAISVLLAPFLPETATRTWEMLGSSARGRDTLRLGAVTFNLGEPVPLFPKRDGVPPAV